MNIMTAHPKLVTFAIGLGITLAIGTAIGVLYNGQMVFDKPQYGHRPHKQLMLT